ncbi:hypothetical protein V865_001914 [Kwoniella europaea PYCC6329]|uniref:BRCT domain-containing protein n=1 Tax=Kwoniella europaea PYCC6329 TaxID=1423913 RepID=A0AAX4KDN1_9TREE
MKSLFKGKRFYIYCPPDHQGEGGNEIVGEEDWGKDVRYCKSDIESYGGQVITSPNYNVNHILIHPTHLEQYLGNFNHNCDYGRSHLKLDLILDIPLEQVTPIDDWDQYEYGIIPWTVDKIIERYGDTTPSGTRKEVILKLDWVKSCISAQRVLDQRYGKFGWAGMRIRSQIAVKDEPEDGTGHPPANPIEVLVEDLDSVFSTPRVRTEELHHDDGYSPANYSGHPDDFAPPFVDQASDDIMTVSGPVSAISGQAMNEEWENDIHAELDRLLDQKGKEKAVTSRAKPTNSLKIHLHRGASILKFVVEDLGHTTCAIDAADVIVLQRLHVGPGSLQTKNEIERQLIESVQENKKIVSSQWLINCHKTCKTLDVKDWVISISSVQHADESLGDSKSLLQSADASDDSEIDRDEHRHGEDADAQLSEPEMDHQVYSVTGRPKRIRGRSTWTSPLKRRQIEMDSTSMSDPMGLKSSSNSASSVKPARRARGTISKESGLRYICKLLLAKPEGLDTLTYLRGCQPKWHVVNWQKSYTRLNEGGIIDRMVETQRLERH